MSKPSFTLTQLAPILGAKLKLISNDCEITGIAPLDVAQSGQISFLSDSAYKDCLNTTQASAVIISPKEEAHCSINALVMGNPYLGYAKIANLFAPKPAFKKGVHPTAVIGENCKIAASASIGANCVLGDRVTIGENTLVSAACMIGDNSTVGDDGIIWPHVSIYHGVHIGHRVIIHSGAVIGSDGFGFANDKGVWHKIPQLGGVILGNDIEVGANTTIDRGALKDTVIGDGVKLDNLIQVAHNVHIGAHTAIAACAVIGGSTKIGKYCMIGGSTTIAPHIEIVDKVILVGTSVVEKAVTKAGIYGSGTGLQSFYQLKKNLIRYRQLDEMARRLTKLEKIHHERDGY